MRSSKPLTRALTRTLRPIRINHHHSRTLSTTPTKMTSLFDRGVRDSDPSFTSLFRFLDDFDTYNRGFQGTSTGPDGGRRQGRTPPAPTFNPRFDVRELEGSYELHGEFPGIERENIHIEFPEPRTIVVRGRIERSYTSGNTPASTNGKAITEKSESHASHKATVEDEAADQAKERGTETQVTEHAGEQGQAEKSRRGLREEMTREKMWIAERSIGEFSRTFTFPGHIDIDAVSAKLSNGVLNIVVPKSKRNVPRRIPILGDN
ncbi:regulated by circadian rhythms/ protein binding protein [Echria macrotheca]|uniref:Regulated by circadian rhythms/ protein binding protein n=1 Tax=Echria macrotheca TaxID=438768 RepID=A0AAJ0BGN1_9PEZI|nr:regulated by circadian rhythms/ protein binding protein [Echria macrotheca]